MMLVLWINISIATDEKCKLRAYKTSYNYNSQYDGSAMLFSFLNGDIWHMIGLIINQDKPENYEAISV